MYTNQCHFTRTESITQLPHPNLSTATSAPSDYADTTSISSSTIPPSYHTHQSNSELPSYPVTPLSLTYSSSQDLRAPPSAFTTNRSRVQGPRSRTSSWSSRRYLGDSDLPPLPSTSEGDPFADSQRFRGIRTPADARRPRQALDGGVRLAGGPLNYTGVPEGDWDYVAVETGSMSLLDDDFGRDE